MSGLRVVVALGLVAATTACSTVLRVAGAGSDADAIRARRASLAEAWNVVDTAALSRLAMGSFVYVGPTGTPFTLAEMRAQAQQVGSIPRSERSSVTWTPRDVRVYAPWKIAVESGEVLSVTRLGELTRPDSLRGVYTAQWYHGPQGWQIQAEIDSPIACSGRAAYCGPR